MPNFTRREEGRCKTITSLSLLEKVPLARYGIDLLHLWLKRVCPSSSVEVLGLTHNRLASGVQGTEEEYRPDCSIEIHPEAWQISKGLASAAPGDSYPEELGA